MVEEFLLHNIEAYALHYVFKKSFCVSARHSRYYKKQTKKLVETLVSN